jgi:hypothetical protein
MIDIPKNAAGIKKLLKDDLYDVYRLFYGDLDKKDITKKEMQDYLAQQEDFIDYKKNYQIPVYSAKLKQKHIKNLSKRIKDPLYENKYLQDLNKRYALEENLNN